MPACTCCTFLALSSYDVEPLPFGSRRYHVSAESEYYVHAAARLTPSTISTHRWGCIICCSLMRPRPHTVEQAMQVAPGASRRSPDAASELNFVDARDQLHRGRYGSVRLAVPLSQPAQMAIGQAAADAPCFLEQTMREVS